VSRRRTIAFILAAMAVLSIGSAAFGYYWLTQGRWRASATPIASVASVSVIERPGTYRFAAVGLSLKVWVDAQGLVQYSLSDLSGIERAHSTERASTCSTWEFMVDSEGRLWFYSGDVGFFVWDGAPEGVSRSIYDDPAARAIVPGPLRTHLH
jgi:hypothetical protein